MTDDVPVATGAIETVDDETPKCSECLTALNWRDYAYVGKQTTFCKRCHQHHAKARQQGDFHPAVQVVMRGKKLVAELVRSNRVARRHGHATLTIADPPAPQPHKRTRAERRAVARKAKAATLAA